MVRAFRVCLQLCEYIMANSTQTTLLVCTFQTLLKFLNWIPLGYIFETQLVKTLVYKFLPQPSFRNDVLACLTEIGSLDIGTIYESLTGARARQAHARARSVMMMVTWSVLVTWPRACVRACAWRRGHWRRV